MDSRSGKVAVDLWRDSGAVGSSQIARLPSGAQCPAPSGAMVGALGASGCPLFYLARPVPCPLPVPLRIPQERESLSHQNHAALPRKTPSLCRVQHPRPGWCRHRQGGHSGCDLHRHTRPCPLGRCLHTLPEVPAEESDEVKQLLPGVYLLQLPHITAVP